MRIDGVALRDSLEEALIDVWMAGDDAPSFIAEVDAVMGVLRDIGLLDNEARCANRARWQRHLVRASSADEVDEAQQ